jgi:hypothetical protein
MKTKKMKYKKITLALFSLILTAAMTSCTLETSDNGDLDGFWHLEAVDTLKTGGHLDLSGQKIFWAVQAKLIHLQGMDSTYYFRFRQTGDSLILHTPYSDHWHQDITNGGDIPVTNPLWYSGYGINALEEPYLKEKLTGSKMILKSATLRLYFTKF